MPSKPMLNSGVKLSVNENEVPASNQRLSRSPHPYHRQSDQLRRTSLVTQDQSLRGTPNLTPKTSQRLSPKHIPGYFDDSWERRKISTSSSDSGTEADDERPPLLKGLPAPNTRPRKGLRAVRGQDTDSLSSPFLTPSQLDERPGSLTVGLGLENRLPTTNQGGASAEIAHLQDKNARRRRAELIRRLLEGFILATVGYISLKGSKGDISTGEYISGEHESRILSYNLQRYYFILYLLSGSMHRSCFVSSGIDGSRSTKAIGSTPTFVCR